MAPLIERIPWSSTAERALRVALNGYESEFRRQVESGVSRLWSVDGGTAYLVTRIEVCAGCRPELVVCALAGRDLHVLAPAIIAAAREHGCGSIRFHAIRAGVGRMARRYGFRLLERVYQLDLGEVGHG